MKKVIYFLFILVFGYQVYGQEMPTQRVAILEIIDKDNIISYADKLMMRSQLSNMVSNTPGYEGYDRVDVESIISEHEFQRSGLVSANQVRKLGEMTGASSILITEVAKFDENRIYIVAKILNVESAKVESISEIQSTTDYKSMERAFRDITVWLLGQRKL